MLTENCYLAQLMMEMKVAEEVRQAETRRLIRQMGGGRPTWLARGAWWLLRQVGRALVSVGQWLQQSAAPRSLNLDSTRSLGH